MKKVILILATLAILADVIVSLFFYKQVPNKAKMYINNLTEEQRSIAERQVDSLFVHNHTDIFPIYYECTSRFVKGNYSAQTGSMFQDVIGYTNQSRLPKDITSTYHVAPENPIYYDSRGIVGHVKLEIRLFNQSDDFERGIHDANWKGIWQTGWALGVREKYGWGEIAEYMIIPYAVSFRKQSFGSLENYVSIDAVLDNAFKFYTENDKSDFKRNLVPNIKHFSWGPYIDNKFYRLEKTKENQFVTRTISDFADYSTYMYNDSYYVFIKALDKTLYELVLNQDRVNYEQEQFIERKKHTIFLYGISMLSVLLVFWVLIIIWLVRDIKEQKQTILQRLIKNCKPQKYVKKHNIEKLMSANDIYSKALTTDPNDEAAIIELVSRAEKELGLFLISKVDIKILKALCNPKRFMKPYDASKVKRSIELYEIINNRGLTYSSYLKIKEEVDKLNS